MRTDFDTPFPHWSDDPAVDGLIRIELPADDHDFATARRRFLDLISLRSAEHAPARAMREREPFVSRFTART